MALTSKALAFGFKLASAIFALNFFVTILSCMYVQLLLADSIRGKGTSLSDLIAISKSHNLVNETQKQYLLGFKHCPNLYGHRTYYCEEKNEEELITDAREISCKDRDVSTFITDISNKESYNLSTCW